VTGSTHALVGAAIGAVLRRPALAFVAGIVSHGVLDCVPHKDYAPAVGLAPDLLGLLTVLSVAAVARRPDILAGAIGGLAPDAEHLIPRSITNVPMLFPSHWFRHDDRVWEGMEAVEIGIDAVAAVLLLIGIVLPKTAEAAAVPSKSLPR
jgi:hypothetical protein